MQERINALEAIVEKYIRLVRDLKRENSDLKVKVKQLELERQALMKARSGDSDVKRLKNFILKKLHRINEKLDREIRKAE